MTISLVRGDITTLDVDAIVNAANNSLLSGGGVDGAIHSAAGSRLLDECKKLNGCATGAAKITSGYNLKAKYIIHTVGPVWYGGANNEAGLLHNAYTSCMELAARHGIQSIAFPNISTGVYHFPKMLAAQIAINAMRGFQRQLPELTMDVVFVCFDEENYNIYNDLLKTEL